MALEVDPWLTSVSGVSDSTVTLATEDLISYPLYFTDWSEPPGPVLFSFSVGTCPHILLFHVLWYVKVKSSGTVVC